MNAAPSGWRRLAMRLAQHASRVLPGAGPWAEAMRHELDYIDGRRGRASLGHRRPPGELPGEARPMALLERAGVVPVRRHQRRR